MSIHDFDLGPLQNLSVMIFKQFPDIRFLELDRIVANVDLVLGPDVERINGCGLKWSVFVNCEKFTRVNTTCLVQSLGDPKYKKKNTEDNSSNSEDLLGC